MVPKVEMRAWRGWEAKKGRENSRLGLVDVSEEDQLVDKFEERVDHRNEL